LIEVKYAPSQIGDAVSVGAGALVKRLGRKLQFGAAIAAVIVAQPALSRAEARRVPAIVEVCAPCHGIDGQTGDVEKPNLAGQKSIYLRQQLLAFRSGKRKHPDMRTISRDLTDREIDQLVIYYSTLMPR
jgi:cytochrome c553